MDQPSAISDRSLRQHMIDLLREPHAHITFKDAVKGFPVEKAGVRPPGSPHSAWELLEHIRIAQEDIVRFSGTFEDAARTKDRREPPKGYTALKWPEDYWPASPAPENASKWNQSIAAVEQNLEHFVQILSDERRNLSEPFPWGDGQTLLREALLIADHNSYHVGQLMLVRKMLE